ncbi:hypothetical protein ES705_22456 [subsurface metagenome]
MNNISPRERKEVPARSTLERERQSILDAKKIAKNTGIVGVAEIPFRAIQFVNGIIITRTLGASIYGIYTTGATILGFLNVAGAMGLRQGAMRYISLNKGAQNKTTGIVVSSLAIAFCASLILSLLLFGSSGYLASRVFHMPDLRWVMRGLAVALPANVLIQVANACIRGFQNIKVYTAVQKLLHPLGSLVFTVSFFLLGYRLHGLVFRDITVGWLVVLITILLLSRTFPPALRWKQASYTEARSLIKFSLPLVFAEFLYILLMRMDVMMIAAFLSPKEVGIYGVVLKLVGFVLVPLAAIDTIIYPMLAEYMGKQDTKGVKRIYRLSVHWSLMMVLPVVVIGTIYSKFLMGLFGKDFLVGYACFGIIACGYLVRAAVGSVSAVLTMGGRSKIILYNTLGAFVLNIVLNYVFIHIWGIAGAALATGLITALWGVVMLAESKVIFGIQLPLSEVLRFLGVGGFVFALVYAFYISNIIHLPVFSFVIGSVGTLGLFAIGLKGMNLVTAEDRIVFNTIVARFRR